MQDFNAPPREAYTVEQVRDLLVRAPAITVGKGLEVIDPNTLLPIEDISTALASGHVRRGSFDTLHGTAVLRIAAELNFGTAVVRPYMTISDGVTKMRFNLGAYYTPTPRRDLGEEPLSYDTACYDILDRLNDAVGSSFSVAAGTPYLTAVEDILIGRSCVYIIDQTAAGAVLPSAMSWPLPDNPTWLGVVNGLLGPIGYQGIWSDWDGLMRVQPYTRPQDRASEFTLTTDLAEAIMTSEATDDRDFDQVPNRWVGYQQNNIDGPPPVDGAGRYEFVNQSTGDTSVDARERTKTRVESFDVADQPSLVASVESMAAADMSVARRISHHTSPFPGLWHFDRLTIVDSRMGGALEVVATVWDLDLDGADMVHEWTVL